MPYRNTQESPYEYRLGAEDEAALADYLASQPADDYMTEDELEDLEQWERAEDEWSVHSRIIT